LNPTNKPPKPSKPVVALAKVVKHDQVLEIKVKLAGEDVERFNDYQRAYQIAHGEPIEPGVLMLALAMEAIDSDRGFAAWRRTNPDKAA